jgi:hypothetical protein
MNVRSEPKVQPALDPGEPACSLKSKVKQGYKIPKARRIVSDTGSWKSRDSSSSGVPGIVKCETPKSRKKEDSFGYRELEESRLFIIRSPRIVKCETPKSRKQEDSFGYRELEESRLFIIRSPRIVKCETPKSRKQEDSFGYRELEESRLFIIRSPES